MPNNNNSNEQSLSRNFSTNPRWTNKDENSHGTPQIKESISSSSSVRLTEKRYRRMSSIIVDDQCEDDSYDKSGFFVDEMTRERDSSFLMDRLRRQQLETSIFDRYTSNMMDEWRGYVDEPEEAKSQNRCDL